MLKWEISPVYTFGVKNIQKSEVRPLHKFEQDLDLLAATVHVLWKLRISESDLNDGLFI